MHATNRLLAQLPRKVLRELAPQLERVDLAMGEELLAARLPWQVHFPLGCVVSVRVTVESCGSLEVALVGREGLTGFPLAPTDEQPLDAVIQTAGAALRLPGKQLVVAMRRHPALHAAVHDYVASLIAQIATNAGCNHYHLLEPRLARRLLMARDCAGSSSLRLTQEFLATLLAVRRVGISEAASSLQRQGLIEYHRGQLTILDVPGLQAAACACDRGALGTPPHRRQARDRATSSG